MNAFLKLAKERKTTYDFGAQKLKNKDILNILEAARWSPSCTNTQPWSFVVVTDSNLISKLMETANYGDFHTPPPLMIAIILRSKFCEGKKHSCFRGTVEGVFDTYMSCGIAASHMLLEAENLGISSCLLTPKRDTAKKLLKVSKEDTVPLLSGSAMRKKEHSKRKEKDGRLKTSCSIIILEKRMLIQKEPCRNADNIRRNYCLSRTGSIGRIAMTILTFPLF